MAAVEGTFWWLSFVDRVDDVALNLGACIVIGNSLHDAVGMAWRAGCNPGGEVAGTPLPKGCRLHYTLLYRLLTEPGGIAEAQMAISRLSDRSRR